MSALSYSEGRVSGDLFYFACSRCPRQEHSFGQPGCGCGHSPDVLPRSDDLDDPVLTGEMGPMFFQIGTVDVPFQYVEEPIVARLHRPWLGAILCEEPQENVAVAG